MIAVLETVVSCNRGECGRWLFVGVIVGVVRLKSCLRLWLEIKASKFVCQGRNLGSELNKVYLLVLTSQRRVSMTDYSYLTARSQGAMTEQDV
jgi:hypothetical protein